MPMHPLQISQLLIIAVMTALSSRPVAALNVDGLIKFTEGERRTIAYTLSNETEDDLFVHTKVNELQTRPDGTVSEVEYTSENVEDWKVSLSLSKFILRAGEVKTVTLSQLDTTRILNQDEGYIVRFSPTKVLEEGNKLSVNYGYGVLSILTTKLAATGEPTVNREGHTFTVTNPTNRFLAVKACEASESAFTCPNRGYLIPGRSKLFTLKEDWQDKKIRIVVSSNDGKIDDDTVY